MTSSKMMSRQEVPGIFRDTSNQIIQASVYIGAFFVTYLTESVVIHHLPLLYNATFRSMQMLPKFYLIFFLFLFQSCASPAQEKEVQSFPIELEVSEASELIAQGDLLLLDVRTPGEVSQGYIEGAQNINISTWEEFKAGVDKLDKTEPVMVYCRVGGRSHKAAVYLVESGFTQVYDIKGGILAWNDAGEPLIKE
ncbi:MAG: rhodanese-related sulfurtransferase [Cryomorphaceae bacterium]|jgi:rhodanese-related sulfurtransferase